jgi:low temperature requirement protein LtrA
MSGMTVSDEEFRLRLKDDLLHRLRPMNGRDRSEPHRAATPLELLYDLVYVVAFGAAANQFAHAIVAGEVALGFDAYLFAIFGVSWAWMNFTWFSSAYGNDDLLFRIATIAQMIGAVVFVLGLPLSFSAAEEGASAINGFLVLGYIVMRVPLIVLWLRAAREDPSGRRTAIAYAVTIAVAQVGWALTVVIPMSGVVASFAIVTLALAEMVAPVVIERRLGQAPWHAGHIAERFALLTLITLGEVGASTTMAVGALVEAEGWSVAAAVIAAAGIVIAAGLWWAYFLIPSRALLERWPERVWAWRYAHLPIFGAIAAAGVGLHVAALTVEEGHVTALTVALSLALPVAAVIAMVYLTWSILVASFDVSHLPMLIICLLPLAAAIVVGALAGGSEHPEVGVIEAILVLVALSCIVEVVVHERVGYKHTIAALKLGD